MRGALNDPDLFASVLAGDSWDAWRTMLIAICGEELTSSERETFRALTGREREPGEMVDEAWMVIGRRSGKTRAAAVLAVWLAALCDHSEVLAPGERAVLPLMSASIQQATKALQYVGGVLDNAPALGALVEARTADSVSLSTRVDIECSAASFRTIRGGTAIGILADEVAFWRNENTANPDTEILNAARPMLATTGGPLIAISSPYSRKGELFAAWRRYFGPDGDPKIVVAHAPSRTMNPGLSEKVIARAFDRDPVAAAAEYGAQFRTDVESFVSREAIEAATVPGRLELPPVADGIGYAAFVDPSGGAQDSMTLAIAHSEGETAILDAVREVKPPFSPDSVVADFVGLLSDYQLHEVTGDRYGGAFVKEQFERRGVSYVASDRSKSEIYKEFMPLLNSGKVELLDLPKLASQLAGLERRTARGGRDSIDHAPGGRDDISNSAAGSIVLALGVGSDGFNASEYIKAWT
jgi:hypothetical protein